jgi:hypothetical protein
VRDVQRYDSSGGERRIFLRRRASRAGRVTLVRCGTGALSGQWEEQRDCQGGAGMRRGRNRRRAKILGLASSERLNRGFPSSRTQNIFIYLNM